MTTPQKPSDDSDQNRKSGPLGTLQTILGAVFGVQSDKKRQEDFTKADPGKIIALGVITVVIIMAIMAFTVSTVLESAGR